MKSKFLALFLGCMLMLSGCTGAVGVAGTHALTSEVQETSDRNTKVESTSETIEATETTEIIEPTETTEIAETVETIETTDSKTISVEQIKEAKEIKPKKNPPLEAVNTKENYEKLFENFNNIYYGDRPLGAVPTAVAEASPVGGAEPAPVVEAPAPAAAPRTNGDVVAESAADMSRNDDYSSTNVQVVGVDEADLIKTDGKFIYYCLDDTLFAVETDDIGAMKFVMSETYQDFYTIEMYLDDSYLIVIGKNTNGYNYSEIRTIVKIYERLDDGSIKWSRTVSFDGEYLTSRKINQSVYVITNSWRYDKKLPFYIDGRVYDVPLENMYVMPDYTNNSIMMVATIDLSNNSKKVDIQSFVGSADIIYMSKEALYISFSRWGYGNYGTSIYKFALESEYVTYESNGSIKGQLLNQFSMDEYEGYLRVAVTGINTQSMSSNAVYILDDALNEVSKIDEIAPGERIYSVRFMGGCGYVVTFRQTDPLFAFDLSDPKNPKLLGALKIPGYSTYLHPYDENHLIGFGQDTVETKNGAVLSTGIKISMFDVTDLTNPMEMFVTYIGDRGSTSPLLNNHKAILQNTAKNIFAFPATENRVMSDYKDEWSYGSFYQQGAFIYSIDMSKGFELRGVISHKIEDEVLTASIYYNNYETDVERIIYIGDYFYTVSRSKIQAHDIESLTFASQLKVGKGLS